MPAFSENEKIDPKRDLYFLYLTLTAMLRLKTDGLSEDKVLAVYVQAISKRIVKTLRMAYNDSTLKVKGHSAHAISLLWYFYLFSTSKLQTGRKHKPLFNFTSGMLMLKC